MRYLTLDAGLFMKDSLYLIEFTKADLRNIKSFLLQITQWQVCFEDPTVILVALRYQNLVGINFKNYLE